MIDWKIIQFDNNQGTVVVEYSYTYTESTINLIKNIKVPIVNNKYSKEELLNVIELNIPYIEIYINKQIGNVQDSLEQFVGLEGSLEFDEEKVVRYNEIIEDPDIGLDILDMPGNIDNMEDGYVL